MPLKKFAKGIFCCSCCGLHYELVPCQMCQGASCYRCLKWLLTCYRLGDKYCRQFHVASGRCQHPVVDAPHQVPVEVPA